MGLYNFGEEQAKKEHFNAEKARLEYEARMGSLVDKDKVERMAFRLARLVRDTLLNLPDRLAGILASETDQHKIHATLTKELRQALEELATEELLKV